MVKLMFNDFEEGKKYLRTSPRVTKDRDFLSREVFDKIDRSHMTFPIEVIKKTEGLIYYKSRSLGSIYNLARTEYDDGNWELDLTDQLISDEIEKQSIITVGDTDE